ncbi:enolase C-terminal domain-like protein [Arenibaculum sp.]|uniref:enolase C-terminal domain-like protein n=1 Tax=Arenibaculum sp. TaxID=2865862 RepID=UPI002E0DA65B|nr:enolase C-terminal domain-like protein [Arenibaculum sp.]
MGEAPGRGPRIDALRVHAYTVPTAGPEEDGTLLWDSTTAVVVEVEGGGETGLGYGYADRAAAALVRERLTDAVVGRDALAPGDAWHAMVERVRNLGRPGVGTMAISAVDTALWDLKAKLLGLPLAVLLGMVRDDVAAYGSGGFTNYDDETLRRQIEGWLELGLTAAKLKVGRDDARDRERVAQARAALGPDRVLMVDANGACTVKRALAQAQAFAEHGVSWFEEPVSSDDLDGLRRVSREGPAGMEIAAGEYGHDAIYFRRMLEAGAVDVLQPDATRCGGVTGFLQADALAQAFGRALSAHTAPSLHAHLGCACRQVRHVEYFHDHARLEPMLFDGALRPAAGRLAPDLGRPGLGLELKRADAERFAA